MRLHTVVAVIGSQLQKLRQILMPCIQIHCHRALAHPKLIHRHSGIIHQLDPTDHAARRAFKPANTATRGPYLAKIQPHATAKLAHL